MERERRKKRQAEDRRLAECPPQPRKTEGVGHGEERHEDRPGQVSAQVQLAVATTSRGENDREQERVLAQERARQEVGRIAERGGDQQARGDRRSESRSHNHEEQKVGTPPRRQDGRQHALKNQRRAPQADQAQDLLHEAGAPLSPASPLTGDDSSDP